MNRFFVFIYTIILLTSGISLSSSARENKDLMRATYYYSHFDFHEAIPYYIKVADQVNDPATYSQLGDCFRLTGNLQEAANWYAKAVKMQSCQSVVSLHYGQVLMQLTQYDEAAKWLKKYQKANRLDKRAAYLIVACQSAAVKAIREVPSGRATLLDLNTDAAEFAPNLWKGNLVFTSDADVHLKKKTDNWTGSSYYSIYSVSCDNPGSCGTQFTPVSAQNINTKYHDGPCTFSADGNTMYFTRSRSKSGFFSSKSVASKDSIVLLEIMIASDYDSITRQFKKITPFKYNSKDYSVAHATISPNGSMLVFSSNMPGGSGGSDLYLCTKGKDNDWAVPLNLGKLFNTEGEELFPYWADNTTLYFSSDGHEGYGGLDIYRARINGHTHSFSAPENVGTPINSSYDDISLALLADGGSSYFSSNRPAAKRGDNIYFYTRQQVFLKLETRDSLTGQPLASVKVTLDATPVSPAPYDTITGTNGLLFSQLYTSAEYRISLSKTAYNSKNIVIRTPEITDIDTITEVVNLYKESEVAAVPKPVTPAPVRFTEIVGKPELHRTYDIGQVPFNYDKFDILSVARPCLDSLAGFLKKNPTVSIEIHAHTDCREKKADYNILLSQKRANSVVGYLKKKGISSSRLVPIGLGSSVPRVECPICEKCTEAQHYQNRIMDFMVVKL
jgi:outer membrane protein OmpA-like peptidoglycan-associated protein